MDRSQLTIWPMGTSQAVETWPLPMEKMRTAVQKWEGGQEFHESAMEALT